MLEEETEFEMVETRNKIEKKRKLDESEQPSKKKKKYDTIMDWGALGEGDDDDGVRDEGLRAWLTGEDRGIISEETVNVQGGFELPEPKRLKQMEIENKKCAKTRRKTLKNREWKGVQLAG